jgi:ketosteroid isomerase-like protein
LSNRNVDVIRAAYEALARGDLQTMLSFVDEELEWTYLDPYDQGAGPQVCYGRHELERTLQHWDELGFTPQPEENQWRADRVMVAVRVPGIDAHYGAYSGDRAYTVLTVRNGQIVALRDCHNRSEALAVALQRAR